MPKGWINKTISFKSADPEDRARYKFASDLPNCTNDFKSMIDRMMAGNHKSFKEMLQSFGNKSILPVSQEFTGMDACAESEEITVEVDAGQFL